MDLPWKVGQTVTPILRIAISLRKNYWYLGPKARWPSTSYRPSLDGRSLERLLSGGNATAGCGQLEKFESDAKISRQQSSEGRREAPPEGVVWLGFNPWAW